MYLILKSCLFLTVFFTKEMIEIILCRLGHVASRQAGSLSGSTFSKMKASFALWPRYKTKFLGNLPVLPPFPGGYKRWPPRAGQQSFHQATPKKKQHQKKKIAQPRGSGGFVSWSVVEVLGFLSPGRIHRPLGGGKRHTNSHIFSKNSFSRFRRWGIGLGFSLLLK